MELFSALGAGMVFSLACNLDTVLAAVGHGMRGGRPGVGAALVVAGVTTAVTLVSLLLGAALLPAGVSRRLGGLALIALGAWYLLDALRGRGGENCQGGGILALSAALAVNNAGVGVAAGATGLDPLAAAGCNFLVTLAALALGWRLGERAARWGKLALPLSGALLVGLGLWQI